MFKVSFKETKNDPAKVVCKAGMKCEVILKGVMKLPYFWNHIPSEIYEWMCRRSKVELYEDLPNGVLIIHSSGVCNCLDTDKYDSLFGERLAESKAKMYIYEFLYDLTYKLYNYYTKVLFGRELVDVGDGNSLERAMWRYEKFYRKEVEHQKKLISEKYG